MQGLGYIESYVGYRITDQAEHSGQHHLLRQLLATGLGQDVYAEQTCHANQIVLVTGHVQHLRNNCGLCPFVAKLLDELLQVVGGGLADGEHMIEQPVSVQVIEFLVEELYAQLTGQQRHVLDNGETHTPLGVLGQLDNGRQQALRQSLDANHLVDAVQVGDDVQAHFGAFVLELS